ncbi:MFS transporter [Xanthomonas campestris pv. phormiicola]|nr:MFS transporter [Xanthomonas campestris pv. phormiicola]
MAIGTMAGALLSAGRDRPRFGLLLVGAGVFGLGCTFAALAPSSWLFAIALVVLGVAALTFTNTTNSLMQLSTEPTMRGRVMALRVGIALGGTPIGAPIVGWLANAFGPRWALGVGAVSGSPPRFLAHMLRHVGSMVPDLPPSGLAASHQTPPIRRLNDVDGLRAIIRIQYPAASGVGRRPEKTQW